MKKLLIVLAFILSTASVCFAEGLEPKIIWNSYKAFPGETININGADFDGLKGVKIQAITDGTAPSVENAGYALEILTNGDSIIQGRIPESCPKGLYAAWVITENGTSRPMYINNTEIINIPEEFAVPGQTVRMSGRNYLNPVTDDATDTKVKFKDIETGAEYPAELTKVSEYSVELKVPENIGTDATYTLMYSNGAADVWAESDITRVPVTINERTENYEKLSEQFGIEAHWLNNIDYKKTYNAKDFGIADDKENSQTEKIQEFFNMVGETGGGVIYFPEGTYRIGHIDIPGNIVLYGDGDDKTIFEYDNSEKSWEVFKPHTFVYGETISMITAPYSNVAILNLAVINNYERPEDDWGYRIGGYVKCLQLGTKYKQFRLGQGISTSSRGYYLKNLRLDTVDGGCATINAKGDSVIDSCYASATHTSLGLSSQRTRVFNTYVYNEQRPGLDGGANRVWVEGCTLESSNSGTKREQRWTDIATYTGPRPMVKTWPAMEHRYFDMWAEGNYIANNTVLGDYGTRYPVSHNDGEGFLTQWTAGNKGQGNVVRGAVSEATELSLTDKEQTALKENKHKNWFLIITGGRGAGQLRKVVSNTTDGHFVIDKEWDVIPDETSRYEIDWFCGYKNIWVHNDCKAYTRKGAFMVYTKGFDYTISNNISSDSSGILFGTSLRTTVNFLTYYMTVDNNIITRDKLGKDSDGGYGYMLSIGVGNDGGGANHGQDGYYLNKPDYSSIFNEYRNNRLELGEKFDPKRGNLAHENEDVRNSSSENFYTHSGITISSYIKDDMIRSFGHIVENNQVINTYVGVELGNGTSNTVISKNNLIDNEHKYAGDEGINTVLIEEGFNEQMCAQNAGIDKKVYEK